MSYYAGNIWNCECKDSDRKLSWWNKTAPRASFFISFHITMWRHIDWAAHLEKFSIAWKMIWSIELIENYSKFQLSTLLGTIENIKPAWSEHSFWAKHYLDVSTQRLYKILYLDLDHEASEDYLLLYFISKIGSGIKNQPSIQESFVGFYKQWFTWWGIRQSPQLFSLRKKNKWESRSGIPIKDTISLE